MSHSSIPLSLWMFELKTVMYLLNSVPSKVVPKTSFELWIGNLRHLHVWGCPTEVRIYNSCENKLDFRTISGYFIGYPKKFKGYRFYCLSHSTRIVESINAKFIENCDINECERMHDVSIQEVRVEVPMPKTNTVIVS